LRIYEGCGRAYLGEVEGANLIKIHRRSGKLSYLVYPGFASEPHPALVRCVRLNQRTRHIECHDYAQSANPPVLHRKETFLPPDHPLYDKFRRLTQQEERHGLLADTATIGGPLLVLVFSDKLSYPYEHASPGSCGRGHRMRVALAFLVLLGVEPAAQGQDPAVLTTLQRFEEAKPAAASLRFYSLDWVSSLKEAKERARAEQRPILVILNTNITAHCNFYSGHT
jgi:hypothetical protein